MLASAIGGSILEHVPLSEDMTVLDFGAGTGLVTGHVAPRVDRVVAADISQAMLEQLASKPELEGKVETVCRDIVEEPLETRFDLIVSAMALHHVEDTTRLMQRFGQQLKDSGRVALAYLDKEDGSFHPPGTEGVFHSGFDRDDLRRTMESQGFEPAAEHALLYTAHFDFDSEELRQAELAALRSLRPAFGRGPVAVVGHTDAVGPRAYNQDLALRRARAVADFLAALDVPAEAIRVEGRGSCCYRASNDTAAGRAENRRVEIFAAPAPAESTSHSLD